MESRQIRVPPTAAGQRLDKYLAQALADLSRSQIQRLAERGLVLIDGRPAKASAKLRPQQTVAVSIPPPEPLLLRREDIPLEIVYEDQDLLVVDKPAGLVVHPAPGHPSGTLVNALLGHWQGEESPATVRPGLIHRLDKDTSGLMVVARHPQAQAYLAQQMKEGAVRKGYLALVRGRLTPTEGLIEAPIGRHPRQRQRMAVVATGRPARTHYRVREYWGDYSLVEVTLGTGRTHQIRVHLQAIGYPVLGDRVYGVLDPQAPLSRQFLHAYRLGFRLPSSGEYREFLSELPPDLQGALQAARAQARH